MCQISDIVPNIVNNTAINIIEKIHTHSLKRFTAYIKLITLQFFKKTVIWKIVTFALDQDAKLM